MFTGIVQAVGEVRAVTPRGGDVEFVFAVGTLDLNGVAIGDSISVSGCCLTVTRLTDDSFAADASLETLQVTTLGRWRPGQRVNMERALRAGDALGGHYVTGHVDGVATVVSTAADARSVRMEFEVPAPLARYIARKGSIAVDGVSLTVNSVEGSRFEVNIIPHTLAVTTFGNLRSGERVNLEIDLFARYVERVMQGPNAR